LYSPLISVRKTGHDRVDRPEPPDGRARPKPRPPLPTTLMTTSQSVAESYQAPHLRPAASVAAGRASCYGSPRPTCTRRTTGGGTLRPSRAHPF